MQAAADKHLDLQPLKIKQLARLSDLPNRPQREDEIGRKLEALGLLEPTATPKDKQPGGARTPVDPNAETVCSMSADASTTDEPDPQPDRSTARAAAKPAAHDARAVPPAARQKHGAGRPRGASASPALFGVIGGRLVMLAVTQRLLGAMRREASSEISAARPDIVDRNGEMLATDVKMVSVFAEPRNIIDKDEAVELLTAVLPDLDARNCATS